MKRMDEPTNSVKTEMQEEDEVSLDDFLNEMDNIDTDKTETKAETPEEPTDDIPCEPVTYALNKDEKLIYDRDMGVYFKTSKDALNDAGQKIEKTMAASENVIEVGDSFETVFYDRMKGIRDDISEIDREISALYYRKEALTAQLITLEDAAEIFGMDLHEKKEVKVNG